MTSIKKLAKLADQAQRHQSVEQERRTQAEARLEVARSIASDLASLHLIAQRLGTHGYIISVKLADTTATTEPGEQP